MIKPAPARGSTPPEGSARLRRSPTLALAEEIEEERRAGRDVLSLSTPTFPEADPARIAMAGASTRLSPAAGLAELRVAAREALFGRWMLPGHRILITAGAKAALYSTLRVLLPPRSPVLVLAPAWPSYADIIELADHRAVFHDTTADDGFRIDEARLRDDLAATEARAILLSNPCNPTGQILSAQELAALSRAAEHLDAHLLVDESFSHIVLDRPAWLNAVTGASDRLTLFNSFSKNYHLQGLRVAAAMVPRARLEEVVACHQTLMSAAPSLSQAVALATLRNEHGTDIGQAYRASHAIAAEIIRRAGWACQPAQGTFYFFPKIAEPVVTFERMRAAGLYPLEGGAFGAAYRDHFRLCFGKPETEMAEIARRLEAAGLQGRA